MPELAEVNTPDVIAAATPRRASANPTVSPVVFDMGSSGKGIDGSLCYPLHEILVT
jgi:hypothetical protein